MTAGISLCLPSERIFAQAEGMLRGTVRSAATGDPLDAATVRATRTDAQASDSTRSTLTNSAGEYMLSLPSGTYAVIASAGTESAVATAAVGAGRTTLLDFALRSESLDLQAVTIQGLFKSKLFAMNEPSYFITGTDVGPWDRAPSPLGNAEQVKFRVAVRYKVVATPRSTYDTGLYFGYTQNSFWHLYDDSAPFFDNNYNPQLFLFVDMRDFGFSSLVPSPRLLVEHESNGRGGTESRSWNRVAVALDVGEPSEHPAYGSIALWQPFAVTEENEDILETNGRGEIRVAVQPLLLSHNYGLGVFGLSAKSRIWGQRPISNIETNLFVHPALFGGGGRFFPTLMLQMFWGTGENLLTHREEHFTARFGIAFVQ